MGRELKRVPLDFDWPIDTVWQGYINPYWEKCLSCNQAGETIARQRLSDLVSLLMLSGEDSRKGRVHPYFKEAPLYNTTAKVCGTDMAELTIGLAGRDLSFIGHDSCDKWNAVNKIIVAAGLDPEVWGICPDCNGEGIPIAKQAQYESWTPTEPPTGEGYQVWETVSEGSPISPVFATAEELAYYMAGRKWGADKGSPYATWLKFINGPGWVPSGVMDERGCRSGIEALGDK